MIQKGETQVSLDMNCYCTMLWCVLVNFFCMYVIFLEFVSKVIFLIWTFMINSYDGHLSMKCSRPRGDQWFDFMVILHFTLIRMWVRASRHEILYILPRSNKLIIKNLWQTNMLNWIKYFSFNLHLHVLRFLFISFVVLCYLTII